MTLVAVVLAEYVVGIFLLWRHAERICVAIDRWSERLERHSSPLSPPAPSGVEEADARPPADPPRPVAGKPDDG